MTPGGTLGRADRAEQEGVEPAPLVEHLVGQHRAVAQVAGAAEVVVDRVEVDAGGAHDLEGLGDDLGTDAVAADDCRSCELRVSCAPENRETAHRGGRSKSARRERACATE